MLQIAVVLLTWLVQSTQATTQLALASNEREVTFEGAVGVRLVGTIALPEHREPSTRSPAVVLVCGSGPTDRDGNQRPTLITDVQKQIATDLAKRGFASLRYDKRGIAASAKGAPVDLEGMREFYRWEHFVDDLIAAFRFLQQQPEIDATRIALVGHSEGGLLVLIAANQLQDKPQSPRAIVLLATPGRPIETVLAEQLARQLDTQGATAAQAKKFLDRATQISGQIRATGNVPDNVPVGLRNLYPAYLGKFLRSMFLVDPAHLAESLKGPVLVINGERDLNVSAERDAKTLDAALRSRETKDATARNAQELLIVPGASHCFNSISFDKDPGFTGPIVTDVLNRLASFLEQALKN
jgi:pimeloyl-ACP methyl ester carboxylesterase